MSSQKVPARERILETAHRLFYRDGFRAVGIDTIIAESGVAKMSLYRHFASKDELIVAHLEHSNRQCWDWLSDVTVDIEDPAEQLVAIFAATEQFVTSAACLGCAFQGTTAEFPDPDHPAHQVAVAHKHALRNHFAELAAKAKLRDPEELACQLQLLNEGALAAARLFGRDNPGTGLKSAATALVAAHR